MGFNSGFKGLNRRPRNNKIIITVVSGAVVFVVMNIVIKVRRGSGVHNARLLNSLVVLH